MADEKMRGSDALRAAWRDRGEDVLDENAVELLAEHLEAFDAMQVSVDGGDRPLSISGTFSTDDPEYCGNTVRKLLGIGGKLPVSIKVFPRGIPWPDQFIVEVVAGRAAQR